MRTACAVCCDRFHTCSLTASTLTLAQVWSPSSTIPMNWPLDEAKFVRLQNELVDNMEKLFVFVLHPQVEATNNRSERQAHPEAMARKAARTSKTERGAKRRGTILSVLASLSKRLEQFTLGSVLSEITGWIEAGRSAFRAELAQLIADSCAMSIAVSSRCSARPFCPKVRQNLRGSSSSFFGRDRRCAEKGDPPVAGVGHIDLVHEDPGNECPCRPQIDGAA